MRAAPDLETTAILVGEQSRRRRKIHYAFYFGHRPTPERRTTVAEASILRGTEPYGESYYTRWCRHRPGGTQNGGCRRVDFSAGRAMTNSTYYANCCAHGIDQNGRTQSGGGARRNIDSDSTTGGRTMAKPSMPVGVGIDRGAE